MNELPITFTGTNSSHRNNVRTVDNFKMLLNQASDTKDKFADIEFGINQLHFLPQFRPEDLKQVSFTEFITPAAPNPISNPTQTATHSGPAAAPHSTYLLLNLNSLPADVHRRVMKHWSDEFITMNEMGPFQDTIANLTEDLTGKTMRTIQYHQVSPNRFFIRSSQMFYFGSTDTKQEDRKKIPLLDEDNGLAML